MGSLLASHTLLAAPIVAKLGATRLEPIAVTFGATVVSDTLSLVAFAICVSTFQRGFSRRDRRYLTATATATYIGRLFLGSQPSFLIAASGTVYSHLASPLLLLAYLPLGAITGVVSAVYIYSIYGFEEFIGNRVKGGYYVQHPLACCS